MWPRNSNHGGRSWVQRLEARLDATVSTMLSWSGLKSAATSMWDYLRGRKDALQRSENRGAYSLGLEADRCQFTEGSNCIGPLFPRVHPGTVPGQRGDGVDALQVLLRDRPFG